MKTSRSRARKVRNRNFCKRKIGRPEKMAQTRSTLVRSSLTHVIRCLKLLTGAYVQTASTVGRSSYKSRLSSRQKTTIDLAAILGSCSLWIASTALESSAVGKNNVGRTARRLRAARSNVPQTEGWPLRPWRLQIVAVRSSRLKASRCLAAGAQSSFCSRKDWGEKIEETTSTRERAKARTVFKFSQVRPEVRTSSTPGGLVERALVLATEDHNRLSGNLGILQPLDCLYSFGIFDDAGFA